MSDAEWRKKNGRIFYLCTGACFALSLLLVNCLPENWNQDAGPLSKFVTVMIAIVPSIGRFSVVSSFPGVTETFLSIIWLLICVTTYLAARQKYPLDRRKWIPQKGRWLVFSGGVAMLCLAIYAFYFGDTPGSSQCYWRDIYCPMFQSIPKSRFWMAVFGAVTYAVCSTFFSAAIVVARNFRRLWLSKSNQSFS